MANDTSNINERETSGFLKAVRYFLPAKGDNGSEKVRKAVLFASAVIFAVSVVQLKKYVDKGGAKGSLIHGVVEQYEPLADENVEYEVNKGSADVELGTAEKTLRKREVQDWAKEYLDANSDVVGYIKIPGLNDSYDQEMIDFPVLQAADNDYYLYKDLYKNYYESGSIFADGWGRINEEGQADNLTIFGHHMGWVGTSFTHLSEYEQGVDFVKKHPVIEFNSIYESGCKYAIVSCFMINTEAKDDNGNLWEYIGYRDFDDGEYKFEDWYSEITKRSWYSNDAIKCTKDDKYITLSTCSKLVEEGVRWVIVAKKLTADDDLELITSSYKQRADGDIYFPQIWKDIYGNKTVYNGWQY
ncbi:class B sortase [uncultured Ruminococcus sp.]|uniref:class B sortase n=1 Tax=uncultured Ruminococcus sp. TaxID=165186 RepID=UPI0025D48E56|nr:class B sortase [uncultured Ruminococcus sp.]